MLSLNDVPEVRKRFKFTISDVTLAYSAQKRVGKRYSDAIIGIIRNRRYNASKRSGSPAVAQRRVNPALPLRPLVSRLGPEIGWLLAHEVSRSTLAAFLETTPENISVIAHREQPAWSEQHLPHLAPEFGTQTVSHILGGRLAAKERKPVRTRNPLDLDELQARAQSIVGIATTTGHFAAGVRHLQELRPLFGRPRSVDRAKVFAKTYYWEAWLLTHLGWSCSSIQAANRCYRIAADLYRRSRSSEFLHLIEDSALVASNSYLIRRDTPQARYCLGLIRDVRQILELRLNTEYYRQCATAALQDHADREARQNLTQAEKQSLDQNSEHLAEILLGTKRQANILDPPNWDGSTGSEEVFAVVSERFRPGTIEFSNALNWNIATALSTDGGQALNRAQDLVERHSRHVLGFGHQATIAALLRIACVLPQPVRMQFVRTALYANGFRDY